MNRLALACLVLLTTASAWGSDPSLIVYRDVPGAQPSEHYKLAVRRVEGDPHEQRWRRAFAFVTECQPNPDDQNAYFAHLSGWSNTYINFETSGPVEVAIARAGGEPIRKAVVHPARKARSCVVRDGVAYVTLDEPCQVAVDIDGQMDDQDTGKGYQGPPIHTVTLFANPILKGRPRPSDPGVLAVSPGEKPPSEGDWSTLCFLPGVHDLGAGFPVHAGKSYYLPGDAIAYGTLNNHGRWDDGHDIRVFGYGTLSGAKLRHPKFADPPLADAGDHNPIQIVGAANTTVEGVTLADSAYHSLMLINSHQPDRPTDIRWVKVFTWRVNGDGINPFGNGLIEDCFLRTQDDSCYVNGRGVRRVTLWNDYNGSAFVLSALPNRPLVVEDCDVIYARAGWHQWSGGRVFNMRGEGEGAAGAGVIFRRIRVEDPRPTLQAFMLAMRGVEPYSNPEDQRGPGDLAGVLFQDIQIAAPSVLGERDVLWGAPDARIKNITFDNVTIGGEPVRSLDHFQHNEHVESIEFR